MIERVEKTTLVLAVLLVCGAPVAGLAGTVNLWGIADADSAYYEYFSDGFYRMDLVDPGTSNQRFHSIADPSVTYGSTSYDGFPNDTSFRLGSVTYDESALVGGTGTAVITALSLGVSADPNDATYFNYYRWNDTATTVNSFSGTVDLVSGQPVVINLNSTVTVTAYFGYIVAPGSFNIVGDRFEGLMSTPSGPQQIIWDFSGTLTTVPEPASVALLGLAVLAMKRRRPAH